MKTWDGFNLQVQLASSPFETWPRSSSAHGHFLKQSPPTNKAQPMRLNCSSERFFFTASGARDVSWIKSPQHLVAARCHQTATARCLFQHVIWVNYNIPLTWNKAILGWFLLLTMIPVRENSEVVIKFTQMSWKTSYPLSVDTRNFGSSEFWS